MPFCFFQTKKCHFFQCLSHTYKMCKSPPPMPNPTVWDRPLLNVRFWSWTRSSFGKEEKGKFADRVSLNQNLGEIWGVTDCQQIFLSSLEQKIKRSSKNNLLIFRDNWTFISHTRKSQFNQQRYHPCSGVPECTCSSFIHTQHTHFVLRNCS